MKKQKKIIDSLPSKVYLNPESKTLLAGGDEEYLGESYLVSEKQINPDQPEYICLDKVWHSDGVYPESHKDKCLLDLGNGLVRTGFMDRDTNGLFFWAIPSLGEFRLEEVQQWAYIKDIVPPKTKKGE